MRHIVYCIENVNDGKLYVGKHSTSDIDDGYMGSGSLIRAAIREQGRQNFRKHILAETATATDAFELERQLVDAAFVADEMTYNLIVGGDSFAAINADEQTRVEKNQRAARAMNAVVWADPEFRERKCKAVSEQNRRLHALGVLRNPDWTGKKHSEATKKAIGRANAVHQTGSSNSRFGTVWIYSLTERISKSVKKEDLQQFLDSGWIVGRKLKWSEN